MNLLEMAQNMQAEVVVFDTAPTGHTLKMLAFPQLIKQGLGKLMQLKDKLGGILGMFGGQQEGLAGNMFDKLKDLETKTQTLSEIMKDRTQTTFVGVCIPEFLSVYETERLVQELTYQKINIENVVVNQIVFPEEEGKCKKCSSRYKMQFKYLKQI